MAKIGLSKPYYAKYSWDGSQIIYSGGGVLGKYTEVSIDIEDADDNILYADNGPAESDTSFAGGTVTITTDDLSPDAMVEALGLSTTAITAEGVTTTGAEWLEFNDDQNVPYLALAGIVKRKVRGAIKWQAFALPKIKFSNPSLAVTTQGETIEWQTQEMNAEILRADDTKHGWFRLSSYLNSEAEAEAAIKQMLEIATASTNSLSTPLHTMGFAPAETEREE